MDVLLTQGLLVWASLSRLAAVARAPLLRIWGLGGEGIGIRMSLYTHTYVGMQTCLCMKCHSSHGTRPLVPQHVGMYVCVLDVQIA